MSITLDSDGAETRGCWRAQHVLVRRPLTGSQADGIVIPVAKGAGQAVPARHGSTGGQLWLMATQLTSHGKAALAAPVLPPHVPLFERALIHCGSKC
jgi:hypothetical protein